MFERKPVMFSRRSFVTLALGAIALMLPARFAAAQDNPKISTVNVGKVFNEMQETKDYKQKMESDRQAVEGEANRRKAEVEEIRKARSLFNEGTEDYNKKNRELIQKTLEFQTWNQLYQLELARTQKLQLRSLFEKIEAATKEVAEARKIDLVIVDQKADLPVDLEQIDIKALLNIFGQRNVMYNNGKFDITAEVLAKVDANYKARK
jgi:Skp family chaperone for outer membrane proteins